MDDLPVDVGSRTHCRAAGRFLDSRPDVADDGRIRMPQVVVDLCKIRHDIRGIAAGRDDIVDSRLLRHVFAHQVDHVIERFDAVECGASPVRGACRVCRSSAKPKLGGAICQRGTGCSGIPISGVPMQRDIHIVEKAVTNHVDLAAATFLSRGAHYLYRSWCARVRQPFLDRNGRTDGTGCEQVVTAGVSRRLAIDRQSRWYRVLVDPRQGVEFGQYCDDRPTVTVAGDERRRDTGDASLNTKALGGE